VIDSLFNLLFKCQHRRTTFPLSPARKKGAGIPVDGPVEMYVVCLDCGRQFKYDWEHMRLGKAVDISNGEPVEQPETPRVPFRTKSKMRYLLWGSAGAAALVLGQLAKSRKRVHKAAAPEQPVEAGGDEDQQEPHST
jgi:hypothetical protein